MRQQKLCAILRLRFVLHIAEPLSVIICSDSDALNFSSKFMINEVVDSGKTPSIEKFDLFISFCSDDRYQKRYGKTIDIVSEIKRKLEKYLHPENKRRLRVCSYEEDFELDAEVSRAISTNIDQSNAVLLLNTKHVDESDFVLFELNHVLSTKNADCLLTGLVNQHPSKSFPSIFSPGALSADFSFEDCHSLSAWRNRLELESAKIAARIWKLPLNLVRDRFLLEKRRKITIVWGLSAAAFITVAILGGIGWDQYNKQKQANILGIYRRYAADMITVQQSWRRGEVSVAKNILNSYLEPSNEIDPRSFEWYTFQQIVSTELFSFGKITNGVKSVTVSKIQPWVAFSTVDKPVQIYNTTNGQRIALLSDSTIASHSIAFSADGSWLAVIAKNKIHLWNTKSKNEQVLVNSSEYDFSGICPFTDSSLIAVDRDGNLSEIRDGILIPLKRKAFKSGEKFRCHFSPEYQLIIGFNSDKILQFVDTKNFKVRYEKSFDGLNIDEDFALMDHKVLLSTGDHVTMVDMLSKQIKKSFRLCNDFSISGVAGIADEKIIVAGDPSDNSLVFWQLKEDNDETQLTMREIGALKGYNGWLNYVRFIPNSTKLLAGSTSGDLKVWDYTSVIGNITNKHTAPIKNVAFGENGDIISSDDNGSVQCWGLFDKSQKWDFSVPEHYGAFAFFGNSIAIAEDSVIHLVDRKSGMEVGRRFGYEPLANTADKKMFAYLDPKVDDAVETIIVEKLGKNTIDRFTFQVGMENDEYEDYVSAIALTDNGTKLLTANSNGKVTCFDITSGKIAYAVKAHQKHIYTIKACGDGKIFATASSDSTVALWNTNTGKKLLSFKEHLGSVQALAFSPDGKTLASGAQDGLIKLYNIPAGISTISFNSHQRNDGHPGVTALAFSPNGSYLISGGGPWGTIILWLAVKEKKTK